VSENNTFLIVIKRLFSLIFGCFKEFSLFLSQYTPFFQDGLEPIGLVLAYVNEDTLNPNMFKTASCSL